jgi:hypothetical protein
MISWSIKGLQEAQRGNLKAIAAVKPEGGLGRAVRYMAVDAHRIAVANTHVETGTLRAGHRIAQEAPARFRIHIDPSARNPRSGARASVYGVGEHNRGGEHAFYERTFHQGSAIADRAARYLLSELP